MVYNKCNVIIALLTLSYITKLVFVHSVSKLSQRMGSRANLLRGIFFVIYIIRCLVDHRIVAFTER